MSAAFFRILWCIPVGAACALGVGLAGCQSGPPEGTDTAEHVPGDPAVAEPAPAARPAPHVPHPEIDYGSLEPYGGRKPLPAKWPTSKEEVGAAPQPKPAAVETAVAEPPRADPALEARQREYLFALERKRAELDALTPEQREVEQANLKARYVGGAEVTP